MKIQSLLIAGFALGVVSCGEREPGAPEQEGATESAAPAAAEAPAVEADAPDQTFAVIEEWRNAELLDHMHAHAEHLDDLNYALDDGNLERATTAAYWLSRHETVTGLPTELQPIVDNMREAARAVEAAPDLEAARAAAKQVGAQCQTCHTAVGVATE